MTASLASLYLVNTADPARRDEFFDGKREIPKLKEFIHNRECQDNHFPPSCDVNLFFGFFFDGTNNNLKRDRNSHSHSNVARLYSAFPGDRDDNGSEAWPDLDTKYHNSFFRTYVPGVGTQFDDVNDSGKGFTLSEDRPKGLAFCYKGQNRIVWALVQALNNVHKYYTDRPLIDQDAFKQHFNGLELPEFGSTVVDFHPPIDGVFQPLTPMEKLEAAFTGALQELRAKLGSYLPVGRGKNRDKGNVINIYASMFGFSRGAAEARAFTNWFVWLCRLDASVDGGTGMSIGSIPVTIDFMGLFDTVASVGLAASFIIADGHQGWADAEVSLRIPPEPMQCLHLVSSHEVRRSFPLDSVLYCGTLPSNCKEIVFPGVHSDIGGGYKPCEQGKGIDPEGADLLSRITLAVMYRAARLAGVPLKLEEAPASVKRDFTIAPAIIETFNTYLQACGVQPEKPVFGQLHTVMAQQHMLYIQWRKKMLGRMNEMPGFASCDKHDKLDIQNADKEFRDEIACFENWRNNRYGRDVDYSPGVPEWSAIDAYWDAPPPPPNITDLFDRYVHDSRAWFKPLGKDIPDLQHEMDMLSLQAEKEQAWDATPSNDGSPNPYVLSKADKEKLKNYLLYKQTHPNSTDYREGLTPESKGRESALIGAGYLRYRKIYMGSDWYKPSGAMYAGLAPKRDNAGLRMASWEKAAETETA
jgi:hypothetical protein